MTLVAFQFAALVLGALSLGFSWAHLMELGARLGWPPQLWIDSTLGGGLYAEFGRIGAAIEVLALVALAGYWFFGRHGPGGMLGLLALGLFALGFLVWLVGVLPMNAVLAEWEQQPGHIPENFLAVSRQWEYCQAAIAVLKLTGFMALSGSVVETNRL